MVLFILLLFLEAKTEAGPSLKVVPLEIRHSNSVLVTEDNGLTVISSKNFG